MSTKIYYGFKTTLSLRGILNTVREFRVKVWEPAAQEQFNKYMGVYTATGKVTKGQAYIMWLDARAEMKRTSLRDTMVDTDFQIVLFPLPKKGFLGMVFTEHGAWYEAWCQQKGFCQYGYWDNTDPDESCTESAWKKRRTLWNAVLLDRGAAIPSMEGFTIDISDPFGPMPMIGE